MLLSTIYNASTASNGLARPSGGGSLDRHTHLKPIYSLNVVRKHIQPRGSEVAHCSHVPLKVGRQALHQDFWPAGGRVYCQLVSGTTSRVHLTKRFDLHRNVSPAGASIHLKCF